MYAIHVCNHIQMIVFHDVKCIFIKGIICIPPTGLVYQKRNPWDLRHLAAGCSRVEIPSASLVAGRWDPQGDQFILLVNHREVPRGWEETSYTFINYVYIYINLRHIYISL